MAMLILWDVAMNHGKVPWLSLLVKCHTSFFVPKQKKENNFKISQRDNYKKIIMMAWHVD